MVGGHWSQRIEESEPGNHSPIYTRRDPQGKRHPTRPRCRRTITKSLSTNQQAPHPQDISKKELGKPHDSRLPRNPKPRSEPQRRTPTTNGVLTIAVQKLYETIHSQRKAILET